MKPFNTSTARATALGCLATLMFAAPVTAEESSGSFGTDIDANPNQQGIVERTATTAVPTSVVETGAGINGNDSLTDAAGGISTVINKGAQAAQEDLAKANKEINDLKNAIANANNVAEPTNQTETKRAVGYVTKVKNECVQTVKDRCRQYGNVTYSAECKQTDTYISGTWVRSSVSRTTSWRKGIFGYMSRPKCSGQNPIT